MSKAIALAASCRDAAVHDAFRRRSQARRRTGRGSTRRCRPRASRPSRARGNDPGRKAEAHLRLFRPGADRRLARSPTTSSRPSSRPMSSSHHVKGSAGFVPGVPRLGIPDQTQTDASIGVRNSFIPSTALPSSLATAASFDPEVVASRRGDDRRGSASDRPQHDAVRRRQPRARTAQRPQLRIYRRGSAACRHRWPAR